MALSCGKVLNRFKDLLPEVIVFIKDQNTINQFEIIKTTERRHEIFILNDLINHLNAVNLKLQVREQFLWDLAKSIAEFKPERFYSFSYFDLLKTTIKSVLLNISIF